jgi:hypothetical protein
MAPFLLRHETFHHTDFISPACVQLAGAPCRSTSDGCSVAQFTPAKPSVAFHAPVVYSPVKSPMFPDSKLFPQNSRKFYALRHPETDRHKQMIHYLAHFYKISYLDGDTSDLELEGEPTINADLVAAVDALESILGLVERNFIEFS